MSLDEKTKYMIRKCYENKNFEALTRVKINLLMTIYNLCLMKNNFPSETIEFVERNGEITNMNTLSFYGPEVYLPTSFSQKMKEDFNKRKLIPRAFEARNDIIPNQERNLLDSIFLRFVNFDVKALIVYIYDILKNLKCYATSRYDSYDKTTSYTIAYIPANKNLISGIKENPVLDLINKTKITKTYPEVDTLISSYSKLNEKTQKDFLNLLPIADLLVKYSDLSPDARQEFIKRLENK